MIRQGFFAHAALPVVRAPLYGVAKCGLCGLDKTCLSPRMPVAGKGKKGILVVGEAAGRTEDERNVPFVGPAGRFLQDELESMGVNLHEDCWVTNALSCRPPNNTIKNPKSVEYCRPLVIKALEEYKPEKVLLFGLRAAQSVYGWLWREGISSVTKWLYWNVPSQRLNAWVSCHYHPSFLLRQSDKRKDQDEAQVALLLFRRGLQASLDKPGRPWDEVPDYRKHVQVIQDREKAYQAIQGFLQRKRPFAFDFENDRLKPDGKGSRIVCCALSDGEITVSYPWDGPAVEATLRLLHSSIPKIGYNAKHEDRWTRKHFGFGPSNWAWDGMLAAHTLDNRAGVCGLKFQSFVLLGQDSYDDSLRPLLKPRDGKEINDVKAIDKDALLLYCGMDALLEYLVAEIQTEQLGVKLDKKGT